MASWQPSLGLQVMIPAVTRDLLIYPLKKKGGHGKQTPFQKVTDFHQPKKVTVTLNHQEFIVEF